MSDKAKLRVKFFISLKDDIAKLEQKMQEWLDSTPVEEDIKTVIPMAIGNVAVLIVLYKS